MRIWVAPLAAALVLLAACSGGSGGVAPPVQPSTAPGSSIPPLAPSVQISRDLFSDPAGQHSTEVEPSAAALGSTVVAAFQMGRFVGEGSSGIGYAVSFDGGGSWSTGTLPGQTVASQPAGAAASASDASVAYDAAHAAWLIATVPVEGQLLAGPYVSRSPDAVHWSLPVQVPPGAALTDKPWIACDDSPSSPYYGRCYVTFDDGGGNGAVHISVSTDGGTTWSAPRTPPATFGLGGEPLVRPDGKVIIPLDDFNEASVLSTVSSDGGQTWSTAVQISPINAHRIAGGLRAGYLQSAAMDAAGTSYVVWPDCRFRPGCNANDIVMSTSSNGQNWSAPQRIPIDAASGSTDHFITGLAADTSARGHLALTYYFYPQEACSAQTCQLYAGFITSVDGGASWSPPVSLTGAMALSWIASTLQGRMVGDYTASVYVQGRPHAVFAAASAPAAGQFSEAIFYAQ